MSSIGDASVSDAAHCPSFLTSSRGCDALNGLLCLLRRQSADPVLQESGSSRVAGGRGAHLCLTALNQRSLVEAAAFVAIPGVRERTALERGERAMS